MPEGVNSNSRETPIIEEEFPSSPEKESTISSEGEKPNDVRAEIRGCLKEDKRLRRVDRDKSKELNQFVGEIAPQKEKKKTGKRKNRFDEMTLLQILLDFNFF